MIMSAFAVIYISTLRFCARPSAVLLSAYRLIECKAFGRQTGTADSLAYQKVGDGICTFFRNAFVYCTGTGIVGMTVDGHVRIRRIFQGSGEFRQGFSGSRTKFALIGGEKDTIVEGYLYGLQVIDILYRLDFSSFDRFQFFFCLSIRRPIKAPVPEPTAAPTAAPMAAPLPFSARAPIPAPKAAPLPAPMAAPLPVLLQLAHPVKHCLRRSDFHQAIT